MKCFILFGILLVSSISAAPSIQLSESKDSVKIGLVEKLDLSLHGDNFCGGSDVYIELIQGSNSCSTRKHGDFDKGVIISWTGNKLGSCLKREFDIENDKISFKVKSTYGNDFCPKTLQINMINTVKGITREVIYDSDGLMNDWVDKNKGGHIRFTKRTTDLDLCNPNPCQNNGICTDEINKYTCNCSDTGFDGKNCEQDINECLIWEESAIEKCQNGGKCVNEIGNFSCDCQKGWEGDFCNQDINECLVSEESGVESCKNGGKCVNEIGNFSCDCLEGWEGNFCGQDVNECLIWEESGVENCKNGGKCVNEIGNFSCDCPKGWEGDFCETDTDDCFPNPCPVGKICIDNGLNDYICECPKYWEGDACDIPQSKFAVKQISLEVDPHTGSGGCGGGETKVQIQIDVNLSSHKCITKPLQFPTGQTTYWITKDELKGCSKYHKFNPDAKSIELKILPTNNNEWYCINSVSLILDDQNDTTYKLSTDDKWRQGEATLIGIKH
jgi:hypothetical protein